MIRRIAPPVVAALTLLAACSGGGDRGGPPPPPPTDGAPPLVDGAPGDGGGGGTDAGGTTDGGAASDGGGRTDGGASDGGGPPPPAIPYCQLRCATPADCTTASAAYDADNYACDASVCRYTGCNTDDECASAYLDDRYVCRDLAGTPTCQLRCATAADCTTASVAFDADNYACEANVCRYTGCNTDEECASAFFDDRYACREAEASSPGLPLPTATRNCVLTCVTATDCTTASEAFDADNYACVAGACRYRGCNTDGECASAFLDDRYVCAPLAR